MWGAKGDTDLDLNRRFHGGGRGKVLLTASRSTEYSFEGEAVHDETGGASIFTTSLIDGIKSGAADSDRDGFIYVPDAYYYAFDQMRAIYARETPQMEINDSGRGILLARNPIGMKISPAVLRDLITGPLSSKSHALLTAEGDLPTGQDMLVRRLFRRDIRRPQHFVPTAEGIRCGGAVRAGLGWGMFPDSLAAARLGEGSFVKVSDVSLDVPLYWQCWKLDSPIVEKISDAVSSAAAGLHRRK